MTDVVTPQMLEKNRTLSLHDIDSPEYKLIHTLAGPRPPVIRLRDYLDGFDSSLHNHILDHLHSLPGPRSQVIWHNVWLPQVKDNYPDFDFVFDHEILYETLFRDLEQYMQHPDVKFEKFLCSFNGSPHISRQILTSALGKMGLFDPDTCSKNGTYTIDNIDGHLLEYLSPTQARSYRKFLSSDDEEFNGKIFEFDRWADQRYSHLANIAQLSTITTKCFLHLVSESYAHSYHTFVTEKLMYSVLTRGLFLAYGQPGWHHMIRDYYGFRLYDNIFEYDFDFIENPVQRLLRLLEMVSKFQKLSVHDWHDLYLSESDNIEYNHYHFLSGEMRKKLKDNSTKNLLDILSPEYRRQLTKYQSR